MLPCRQERHRRTDSLMFSCLVRLAAHTTITGSPHHYYRTRSCSPFLLVLVSHTVLVIVVNWSQPVLLVIVWLNIVPPVAVGDDYMYATTTRQTDDSLVFMAKQALEISRRSVL